MNKMKEVSERRSQFSPTQNKINPSSEQTCSGRGKRKLLVLESTVKEDES